jgi:hypothetical protein
VSDKETGKMRGISTPGNRMGMRFPHRWIISQCQYFQKERGGEGQNVSTLKTCLFPSIHSHKVHSHRMFMTVMAGRVRVNWSWGATCLERKTGMSSIKEGKERLYNGDS